MTHSRPNRGVCSGRTTVELNDDGTIQSIRVTDGCEGNLTGLCTLLAGLDAGDAAARLRGIRCGRKATSCPDQISLCLEEALAGLRGQGGKKR